jgi:hypothetical protein
MNILMQTVGSTDATTGMMLTDLHEFFTIELPWLNNQANKSCVPDGTYELIPYNSPMHGPTWCLHNPTLNIYGEWPAPAGGRTSCEIHSANWATQLLGCIALGEECQPMLDPMTGCVEPAIENSKDAVAMLIAELGSLSSGHTLTIERS